MVDILLEIFYILSGLVAFSAAYMAFKDYNHPKKIGTAIFWILLGLTFMIGKYIPSEIVGIMILAMGAFNRTRIECKCPWHIEWNENLSCL